MFHPAHPSGAENEAGEWLELHNPEPFAVALQGWRLAGSVEFDFPDVTLPANGYLVVAADLATFQAAHPGVTNVVGGWVGGLGNIDDSVSLLDAGGTSVDKVHYDTEGDWAERRNVRDLDALGYPLGWTWISEADGGGKTLELANPALSNNQGQNWRMSVAVGGSPGGPNAALTTDGAPLIPKTAHAPAVPEHTQIVRVTTEVEDELATGLTVVLKWRLVSTLSPGAWHGVPMHDDGLNGDESAADGVWTGDIPAQAAGAIVGYHVEATDATAHVRTWPAATDAVGNHDAPALYQVDEESVSGTQPMYRLILPAVELDGLDHQPVTSSNRTSEKYAATFVARVDGVDEVRQQASVRLRGAGSRGSHPRGVRVDFLNAEPWQGNVAVNLNTQYTYLQFIGARLAQAAGVTVADSRPVQVRFNGVNRAAETYVDPVTGTNSRWTRHYGSYVHVEPINRGFVKHHFPADSRGNLYTKRGTSSSEWNVAGGSAVLADFYTGEHWEKQNNTSAADWTDLHQFVSVMSANAASPGAAYVTNIDTVMDIDQWLQTMALATVLTDGETNLTNGRDDDYSMYRGADGRFRLLFHDLDTILGSGDSSAIGIGSLPHTIYDAVEPGHGGDVFDKLIPFFQQPAVLQAYTAHLRHLLDTTFAKPQFDALVDEAFATGGWPAADIGPVRDSIKAFMDVRRADIAGKISAPLTASATGLASVSGYERTTSPAAPVLTGSFDVAQAGSVTVNGVPATLDRRSGTWTVNGAAFATIVPTGATWKYKDDGSDQGTAWRSPAFDDSAWASGPAQLGYGGDGEVTVIAGGENTHMTDYFRLAFDVPDPGLYQGNLTLRLQRDDGVVLYLNGTEIVRDNMPSGTVTHTTQASSSASPEGAWLTFTVPAASLLTGGNVLAAEVHQVDSGSSDSRFNLELLGTTGGGTGGTGALNPGINRFVVEEKDSAGAHLRFLKHDVWFDDGSVATKGGTLSASETWTAAGGPYLLSSALTIGNGVTLTIQPGTTVYSGDGVGITITGTGRLVAEGTATQHIRWTRQPGTTALAGRTYINGATGEQRWVYNDLEWFGGAQGIECTNGVLLFSHCTFTNTDVQYISFHNSSFIVEDSHFETYVKPAGYPPATYDGSSAYQKPEMLHGASGIPSGGYAIFRRNIFGHTFGFNDVIDFTGGNHPSAVLQITDNVFTGATDDHLDLDNTDAWIAGNVFLHAHQDTGRSNAIDSSSAISGGLEGSNTEPSEWTILGNIFYDVDHAVLAKGKDGASNTRACRFVFLDNTVLRVTAESDWGSHGSDIAVFNFQDNGALLPPASGGAGAYVAQNVIWDAAALVANYNATKLAVTLEDNLLPVAWSGPGAGNVVADPRLDAAALSGLRFAAVEREDDYLKLWELAHRAFAPCAGSPALGTGMAGTDKGGADAGGIRVSGAPTGTTALTTATLTLGPQGTFAPPASAFPGFTWGYLAYKYSVDGGAQSAERPVATPIALTGLAPGTHTVRVWGKNDSANAGDLSWQTAPTVVTWTVDPAYVAPVVISEVLAVNTAAWTNGTAHPDFIELFNPGVAPVVLDDWAVSDDPLEPRKYVFPVGTVLAAGERLVLNADDPDGNPGLHLGFSLDGDGEHVVLSASPALGGGVVDAVTFGLQVADLSIGRVGSDAHWDLTVPTPGAANVFQPQACPGRVFINEWVASSDVSFAEDQVELYNPDDVPAAIGGFTLTDTPDVPGVFTFPPLTFLPAGGFRGLVADGTPAGAPQANHLPFALDSFYEWIVLGAPDGSVVDQVAIMGADADVAAGRLPDGGPVQTLAFPSIGFTNVDGTADSTTTTSTTLVAVGAAWSYNDALNAAPANDGAGRNWKQLGYTATGWKTGGTPIGTDPDLDSATNPATGSAPFFTTDLAASYSAARVSYYFRKVFTFSGDPAAAVLRLNRWVDDGYNLYLNGQRIDAKGTLPATPAWSDLAGINVNNAAADNGIVLSVPAGVLVAGDNLLAAEVHQTGTSSGDVAFALDLVADETVTIPGQTDPVRHRMMDLTDWLRITEVMYDPVNGTEYEFLELRNLSPSKTLDLTGVRLDGGVSFTFPTLSLPPGAYTLVVRNPVAFQSVYGAALPVAGAYGGKLDNGGEEIVLLLPAPWTAAIQRFKYEGEWFAAADGLGASLEVIDPTAARATWDSKLSWRRSVATGGSPAGFNAVTNFTTWAAAYGVVGTAGDEDGDGLDHLMEYALGLDPHAADSDRALLSGTVEATGHLEGRFEIPAECPSDVTYVVEVSSSLAPGAWTVISSKVGNAAWTGAAAVSTAPPSGGRTLVTVRDTESVATTPRHFMRLTALLAP